MEPELPADVLEAVHANRKIDAIRLLREQRDLELKEAKRIIDAYVAARPHLTARRRFSQDSGLGRLVLGATIAAVAYAMYRFWLS